jgi:hypothetical protein
MIRTRKDMERTIKEQNMELMKAYDRECLGFFRGLLFGFLLSAILWCIIMIIVWWLI